MPSGEKACENCERCTWNPGPDCGRPEHPRCETCGHCEGRHKQVLEGTWVAVWMSYHQEQHEEYDSFAEALASLWGTQEAGVGAPVRIIRPNGSTLEGDGLDRMLVKYEQGWVS